MAPAIGIKAAAQKALAITRELNSKVAIAPVIDIKAVAQKALAGGKNGRKIGKTMMGKTAITRGKKTIMGTSGKSARKIDEMRSKVKEEARRKAALARRKKQLEHDDQAFAAASLRREHYAPVYMLNGTDRRRQRRQSLLGKTTARERLGILQVLMLLAEMEREYARLRATVA